VHDVGVVHAGEDEAGSAHVGRELVDLVEGAVDHAAAEIHVAQIAQHEIIRRRFIELGEFQVHAADPEALNFEAPN
jgi:hypothetical protein